MWSSVVQFMDDESPGPPSAPGLSFCSARWEMRRFRCRSPGHRDHGVGHALIVVGARGHVGGTHVGCP
jgi:hypothetical protein